MNIQNPQFGLSRGKDKGAKYHRKGQRFSKTISITQNEIGTSVYPQQIWNCNFYLDSNWKARNNVIVTRWKTASPTCGLWKASIIRFQRGNSKLSFRQLRKPKRKRMSSKEKTKMRHKDHMQTNVTPWLITYKKV